ncbi:membrane protein [Microtetraspora sp. NBRC 13810]|uniref:EI24 domain-containing protein n=1 Tax=Microtetraspora sp. NBRC 13810 TaxID=3030990 RepID=UPI0024A54787|nr:EI24 domain-containing protein [Microtetraspora sp. NBRC 13810]GLW13213.1 membrane protein [Microtetraspora sp. NBRC 13810]
MGSLRAFLDGIGFFFQGLRWVARHPRWWFFGLLPALVSLVVYVIALIVLGNEAGDLAAFLTPFADGWSPGLRDTARLLLGLLIFGAGLALAVLTFTALTLAIGEPFYEKLSEKVEESYGEAPSGYDEPLWRSIPRSIRDSLVTLGYVLLFTIPLFALGFVPVVGQTVVPVLGAAVSGFFLTVELTALGLERRGVRRKERFALLRANRATSLGFGVLIFVIFLVPLLSVVAMPAAVAGAAIMVRLRLAPAPGHPHGRTVPPGAAPRAQGGQ